MFTQAPMMIILFFLQHKLHQFLLSQEQQDSCDQLCSQHLLNVNITNTADVACAPHFQATVEEIDNGYETCPHLWLASLHKTGKQRSETCSSDWQFHYYYSLYTTVMDGYNVVWRHVCFAALSPGGGCGFAANSIHLVFLLSCPSN